MVAKENALGGTMTMEDLADYKGEWVEPVMSDYHGFTLAELPPPSQGFAANEMLNILAACTGKVYPGQTLASLGPTDARYWHMLIEAKTLAYADLNRTNGDPNFNPGMATTSEDADQHAHANELCSKISPDKAMPSTGPTVPTAAATRSCFPLPTAGATWCHGSIPTMPVSVRASPCRAMALSCTIAAGCSRSTPTAPM